ncbi:nitroreductase family protein [Metallibacterium sp.]
MSASRQTNPVAQQFLSARRSIPARLLTTPGPDTAQRAWLLQQALRAPDHGVLAPWRLISLDGAAKLRFGERLAALALARDPALPDDKREKERSRYSYAPWVLVVVARIDAAHPKIPAQEQLLSAGCVAHNLLLGAQALGYGAQWLTGWAAYDAEAAALLGLASDEHVIGFVHIGSARGEAAERARPTLADKVSTWMD